MITQLVILSTLKIYPYKNVDIMEAGAPEQI